MGIYKNIVRELARTKEGQENLFLLAVGLSQESRTSEKQAVRNMSNELYLKNAIDEVLSEENTPERDYLNGLKNLLGNREDV